MLKIKVKFLHLCLLAIVFIVCIAFLYKDIYKLKSSLNLFQKTLESMYVRVNHIESYNKLNHKDTQVPSNDILEAVNKSSTYSDDVEDIDDEDDIEDDSDDDEDDEDDDESLVKSEEYQDLLRHMSQLMDNDIDSDKTSETSETYIEEIDNIRNDIDDVIDSDELTDTESIDEPTENFTDTTVNQTVDAVHDEPTIDSVVESEEESVAKLTIEPTVENEQVAVSSPLTKTIQIDTDDIKVNIAATADKSVKNKEKYTNKSLNLKTVNELKEILKNKNLSTKGNKKELISRIL